MSDRWPVIPAEKLKEYQDIYGIPRGYYKYVSDFHYLVYKIVNMRRQLYSILPLFVHQDNFNGQTFKSGQLIDVSFGSSIHMQSTYIQEKDVEKEILLALVLHPNSEVMKEYKNVLKNK